MKQILQRVLRRLGYDIFKHDGRYHEVFSRNALLKRIADPVVLDVGANGGQFALELRDYGYKGRIVSFEPLSSAHAKLLKASGRDEQWMVAERSAIGGAPGEAEINISRNSVSSSLLPLGQCHLDVAPSSAYIGKESVKVIRLDDAIQPFVNGKSEFYLKVDTQGYERHVLEGAPEVLKASQAVELELSLTPTYDGCFLFAEGMDYMKANGFRLYSTYQVLQDRQSGELMQTNAFFVRDPNP